MVGELVGDSRDVLRDRKEVLPVLVGWNRKSRSPCCQEQGQETRGQPQAGHSGCVFNHCRHLRR